MAILLGNGERQVETGSEVCWRIAQILYTVCVANAIQVLMQSDSEEMFLMKRRGVQ